MVEVRPVAPVDLPAVAALLGSCGANLPDEATRPLRALLALALERPAARFDARPEPLLYVVLRTPCRRIHSSGPWVDTRTAMTTDTLIKVGISAASYLLFLWVLTWPLRHASWLKSRRWEAHRRQAFRWQTHYGGR